MKKILIIGLSALMILSSVACTGGENTYTAEKFEPYSIGDFSAQNLEGETITKDIFSDYDLTMVNLWTTTCPYCINEMPYFEELRQEFADEGKSLNIIGICLDAGKVGEINEDYLATAKEVVDKTKVTYTNIIPDDVLIETRLKEVQSVPESFFVDSEGNIVSAPYMGANSKDNWSEIMNNELEKITKEQ